MYFLLLDAILDEQKELERAIVVEKEACAAILAQEKPFLAGSVLHFRLHPRLLERDCIGIAQIPDAFICSEAFLDAVADEATTYRTHPVAFIDAATGVPLPTARSYFFWTAEPLAQSLDWNNAEYWIDAQSELGGHYLITLHVTATVEERAVPFFRTNQIHYTFVEARMRERIETRNLVGVAFAALDAMYSPYLGVRRLFYERVVQQNPENVNAWYEIGKLQRLLHHQQAALEAINHALYLQPDWYQARFTQAIIFHSMHQLQQAAEAFQEAIGGDANNAAWLEYIQVLRELGRNEEALALIEHQRQAGMWDTARPFWYELGATLLALGRIEEALQAFDRAIALRGSHREEAYEGKGKALYQLGRYEEALAAYTEGLKGNRPTRALWQGKVSVLSLLGRDHEAEEAAQKLQKLEQTRKFRMQIKHV